MQQTHELNISTLGQKASWLLSEGMFGEAIEIRNEVRKYYGEFYGDFFEDWDEEFFINQFTSALDEYGFNKSDADRMISGKLYVG
jgi:hypothetical protein